MTRIVKIGGSLLTDGTAFEAIAARLHQDLDQAPTWIVVSAARGVTERLRQLARDRDPVVSQNLGDDHLAWGLPPALASELKQLATHASHDDILAWGERASAAILQGRLADLGRRAPIVELRGRSRLPVLGTAIVPGFYLRDVRGRRRLLPRGGSDIAALLVATWTGAETVHLWKEGGGIRFDGLVSPILRSQELLLRIGSSIHPLHPAAARIAQRRGIELVLEDPWGRHPSTNVCDAEAA